ncbi:ribonuclease H-like protein [Rostrohypoxylon terebratum]|nr:ribonuclease H-like protein [Rostrohypoxylon terebratum]
MAFRFEFFVNSSFRRNGHGNVVAAAAACMMAPDRRSFYSRSHILEIDDRRATSMRAQLQAVILALDWALDTCDRLNGNPRVDITIYSDSEYAIRCMGGRADSGIRSRMRNALGMPRRNADLIEEASHLANIARDMGRVTFVHIPREVNTYADSICNETLDEFIEEFDYGSNWHSE